MRIFIGLVVLALAVPVSAAIIDLGGVGNNVGWDDNPGSAAPWTGDPVAADGTPGPAWADGLLAQDGQWYGGVQSGGAQSPKTTDNVIGGLTAGDTVQLTGWMFMGSWNQQIGVVQLLDGAGSGTVLAEMRMDMQASPGVPTPWTSGWQPLTAGTFSATNPPPGGAGPGTLSGVISGTSVTVRVGWVGSTPSYSNGTAVYMDATPEPATALLLLLAGAPLLVRRRR